MVAWRAMCLLHCQLKSHYKMAKTLLASKLIGYWINFKEIIFKQINNKKVIETLKSLTTHQTPNNIQKLIFMS